MPSAVSLPRSQVRQNGAVVDAMEKAHLRPGRLLGWFMLATAALLLVLMPLSGTWLLLPPAFALGISGDADRGRAAL